jgi:ferrochelatase
MRYSAPTIGDAARDLVGRGAERLAGICMSPQWSPLLMGGYANALAEAAAALRVPSAIAPAWYREPAFIASTADRLMRALQGLDPATAVVLTAHSLPRRVFEAEPGYIAQLRETAELVAARAHLAQDRWQWAYQSAGHTAEEWLRPDLKDIFPLIAAAGHRDVLVAPVQFLADHLEVLYDLDVGARGEAEAAGLRYHRTPMPNTEPAFISALATIARASVAESATAPS